MVVYAHRFALSAKGNQIVLLYIHVHVFVFNKSACIGALL